MDPRSQQRKVDSFMSLCRAVFYIGFLVVPDALLAIGFGRDDRLDPIFLEQRAKSIGVISPVDPELEDVWNQAHACFGYDAITGVAGREH
jgi:hypothetical protein